MRAAGVMQRWSLKDIEIAAAGGFGTNQTSASGSAQKNNGESEDLHGKLTAAFTDLLQKNIPGKEQKKRSFITIIIVVIILVVIILLLLIIYYNITGLISYINSQQI